MGICGSSPSKNQVQSPKSNKAGYRLTTFGGGAPGKGKNPLAAKNKHIQNLIDEEAPVQVNLMGGTVVQQDGSRRSLAFPNAEQQDYVGKGGSAKTKDMHKLKLPHAKLLFIVTEMWRQEVINETEKGKLKDMVITSDIRLFEIMEKYEEDDDEEKLVEKLCDL